jgi:6,7-dimethyl-8-ribityllumazine synthase
VTTYSGHLDGRGSRIAIACSRFNDLIVTRLLDGARDALVRHGVAEDAIDVAWVPGAWELALVVQKLAASGRYDAVVALGAVIRGATYHFDIVAGQSASALNRVALDTGVPVANGVLTVDTIEQAIERAGTKAGNKGIDAALAALELIDVLRRIDGKDD